jgi:hypothetical protein
VFTGTLAAQVGMFPDVCESLSLGHLSRGDATSAMVASEWYMRNNHFPGWARPYEFASELFRKVCRSVWRVVGGGVGGRVLVRTMAAPAWL